MTGKSIRILLVSLSFLVALVVSQPAALADTVQMKLTAPPPGPYLYDVYISPYLADINGTSTPVICDDFRDDSFHDETWTANVYDSSSLSSTRMKDLSGKTGPDLTQAYDAIGWLALQLMGTNDITQRGYISFAIWDIFSDTQVYNWLYTRGGTSGQNPFYDQMLSTWVAPAMHKSGYASLLTVYSPDGVGTCGTSTCGTPQEFVTVRTSEASAPIILAFDLLALVGAVFLVRRRSLWNSGMPR